MFIERALKSLNTHCSLQLLASGNEAIAYLNGEGRFHDRARFQFPGYIITDLKMADGNGFDILQFLRTHPDKCIVPVIVLSGACDSHDITQAYQLGASGFLEKPSDPNDLRILLQKMYDFFSECEVPEVTSAGRPLATNARGKIHPG